MRVTNWEKEQYAKHKAWGESDMMKGFFPEEETQDIETFVKEMRIGEATHYLSERPGTEVFNDPDRAQRVIEALLRGIEAFVSPKIISERYFMGTYGVSDTDGMLVLEGKFTVDCDELGNMEHVSLFEVTEGPTAGRIIKPLYVFPQDMNDLKEVK